MTTYNTFGTVVDVTRAVIGTSTLARRRVDHLRRLVDRYASPIDRATLRSVGIKK